VPVSAPALGVAGAGPPGDTDRGESAGKGWSLVCNGAALFCDEGLAARPGGGKRDVTGEPQRARENSAYVRKLLGQRQPEFAAALAFAEQYFSCLSGWERRRGPA
jgi:hypothetical protein